MSKINTFGLFLPVDYKYQKKSQISQFFLHFFISTLFSRSNGVFCYYLAASHTMNARFEFLTPSPIYKKPQMLVFTLWKAKNPGHK